VKPRLRIGTYILRAVLVTNGAFTAKAQREAKIRSIDLIAADDLGRLLAEIPCTLAEVEMMEDRRLGSMRDVQVAIESLVSSLLRCSTPIQRSPTIDLIPPARVGG
jgi:hypothetical protein